MIHWQATVHTYLIVIAGLKWSNSKLVFIFANEPKRDVALDLLTQRLQAELGLFGRPALDVLGGFADTVELLFVAIITALVWVIVVDPVGPEATQLRSC